MFLVDKNSYNVITGIPNITCGDAFYTTTKSPLGNLTLNPDAGKSVKFSTLTAYTRTFKPGPIESMTHPGGFAVGKLLKIRKWIDDKCVLVVALLR